MNSYINFKYLYMLYMHEVRKSYGSRLSALVRVTFVMHLVMVKWHSDHSTLHTSGIVDVCFMNGNNNEREKTVAVRYL